MTATTILLGNLRLVGGEVADGTGRILVCGGENASTRYSLMLTRAEFASLQSVAAVVEAAKEWDRAHGNGTRLESDRADANLCHALDTLTAGGEK